MLRSMLLGAAGAVAVTSFGFPALAAQPFDGPWSVKVATQTPDARCKGRRVSLRVADGNVKYAGLLSGLASGKVDTKGRLTAQIARVRVSGKLVQSSGSGAWQSPNCRGTWTAHRQ